tara:strand:- start:10826 stop:11779 length:954 start_codon:yes stop_codon:yes gene_type:complete
MKKTLFLLLLSSSAIFAQQKNDSIKKTDSIFKTTLEKKIGALQKQLDSVKKQRVKEKESKIKEWTVNGRFTFLFNQASFTNWTAGGENNVAGNISVNYDFNYRNEKWKWDNKIIAVYGSSHLSSKGYRKTDDRFEYNSVLALNSTKNWYFSFFTNLITQFTHGFDYNQEPRKEVSSIFSPAYLSFGPGILWRKNENMRVNIAPASSRFTFVSKPFSGQYGVEEGKTSTYGLGFNMSAYLKFQLMEDLTMENIVALYSNYLRNPQNVDVNYQINFLVSVNKYLSTNFTLHVIADNNASSRVQFREVFGLGLNYTFHEI